MSTPSLFKQTATGIFWIGGGQITAQVVHLIIRLILARLLVPQDFGLVAMAMVVVSFTWWFLDLGFGQALVQRKELTEAHRSTAFWSNIILGWFVFLCLALTSPLVAIFFDSPQLGPVLIALSFSLVLISPRATLENLLIRDFKFQYVASRKILGTLVGGSVGIILAFSGFGVWALVGQTLTNDFVSTVILFWQSSWRPGYIFCRQAFADLWAYSMPLTGALFFNYFNRNLDTILIGRFLDATSLGLYNLAYQLVLMPLIYVTRPVNQVLFTALSKLQDEPQRMQNAYLKSLQLVAFVTFPLMTFLVLAAPTLIPTLLGQQWQPAVSLIPFLSLVGLIQSVQGLMPAVFQATGKTALIFRWTMIYFVGNVGAFGLGLRWGILGVAVAYSSVTLLLTPISMSWLLRTLDLSWGRFLRALFGVFSSTVVLVLIWIIVGWLLSKAAVSPLISLATQFVLAGGGYIIVLWPQSPIIKRISGKIREIRELVTQEN